jgi:hypothetical protein
VLSSYNCVSIAYVFQELSLQLNMSSGPLKLLAENCEMLICFQQFIQFSITCLVSRYTEHFVFHYDEKFTCRIGTDYNTIVIQILILEQFVKPKKNISE